MSDSVAVASPTQTLELARFATTAREEEAFLASHAVAMRAVKAAYPGLLSVSLVRLESTSNRTVWVDVALWDSEAQAQQAAAHCMGMPEFVACMRYMVEDLDVEHGEVVAIY